MNAPSRRVVAAAVALTVLVLAGGAAARRHAGLRTCATPGLVVWLKPASSGAAGSIYYQLRFTNLSGHACELRGFPGVSAVTLRGSRIGNAASRDASKKRTVRLAQAETASAVVRVANVRNYPIARCRPVIASGLRVFPPGARVSKVIPFVFRTCRKTGVATLGVKAVTKRATP